MTEPAPDRRDGPQHPAFEAAVAGGMLNSEGPGSAHRYRNVILGGIAILLLAMAMLTSYSSAFGDPTPNNVHLAVTGDADAIVALEQQGSLDLTVVASDQQARTAVLDRDVDGAVVLPAPGKGAGVTTYIASGGGRGLGQAISGIGDSIAAKLRTTNTAADLAPLPKQDPVGSIEFYAILFAGLGAALGATVFGRVLGTVDTAAKFIERSIVLVLYTGLLAGLITLWIDSALGAVTVGPWAVFGTLWLTGLAIGGAVTGVAALGGTIAALVMTLALVILGNTSSGGPLGIHVLNDFFQTLYHVFPQGDALDLLRSVQYFDGAAVAAPIIRLSIWAVAGILLTLTAMLIRNRREAAARPKGGLRSEHDPRQTAGPSGSHLEAAAVTPNAALLPLTPTP
ncbi:ABC transporter permease [Curtobacterium flaccumfaciens pv. flaccumfaciens]|uniref:ABC transporter permease n=1 Tax=Curtobacterium poinsettiae TaxID=159612 RepID=UPI00217CE3F6|nr:ABC transporter permease [Curtobacterium flaccumfaciens]MCS6564827.1 ABC transporter permease [Curtobacterium flaccumfaciens pv. flaccumfaciens]